ncbi:MAG: SurA N-terminal domain-containing protein, partial [Candidatus Rokubacteria bacterium]|nr:SurA N-terminal domain-containing protein [Candidatus Rokubacteria bacterium]
MRLRALALPLVAALLAGCAMPTWVPVLGKRAAEKRAAEKTAAAEAPPAAEGPLVLPRITAEPAAPVDEHVADRIIAVVNNDAITLTELQEAVAFYRQEHRQAEASDEELMKQFLPRVIEGRLQLQEAEREKVIAEDAEVDDEINDRMKKFGAQSREQFEAMLRSQGLSIDLIRRKMRDQIRVEKVKRRKVAIRVTVTDPEIDQYLEDNRAKLEAGLPYHARHILMAPEANSDAGWEAARIRAALLRAQIVEGLDFAEAARKYSQDATASDGGDLGTLKRGELSQDVETQILTLQT